MKKLFSFIIILTLLLTLKISLGSEVVWNTYRSNSQRWGYSDSFFSPPLMEAFSYIGNATFSSPVYSNGKIFVGSGDKNLYCFDAETGKVIWNYETDGAITHAPTYDNGKIYFGTVDGYFFCLDESNPQKYFFRYNTYSKIYVSPLVLGNNVYFGTESGLVYALDKLTGKEVWNSPFPAGGRINSAISGDDTSIFFISQDGYLYAVHPLTGSLLWKKTVGPNVKSTPVIKGNYVYVLNNFGQLLAINRTTRNQDWYYSLNQDSTTSLAISNDLAIVLGKNGKIACVDLKTGNAKWEKNLSGSFDTSPVVTDKYIFVGDSASTLYMLSIENGTTSWFIKYEKGFYNDFLIQDNKLYTVGLDFSLRCFVSQPPPSIQVEPITLDFGEVNINSQKTLSLNIKNKGGGTLSGTLQSSVYWIKVSQAEFSGNDVIINVTVDTTGFEMEKTYTGKISIKSNGGNVEVLVILKTLGLPPVLSVSPKLFNYGNINRGAKKVVQITIKNLGGGELFGTLSTDVNWIEFDSINFKGNNLLINITINAANLVSGHKYKGFIYIESNGGKEIVEININVVEPNPQIFVDTNTLNFGEVKKGDSPTKMFVISNKGGGILTGTLTPSQSWIILNEKIFSGNEFRVLVTIDTSSLKEGEVYREKINISSNGGSYVVEIYIKIKPKEVEKPQKITLILQIGNKIMYVNNIPQQIDVPPTIIEGRTLLPIRWVAEPLGATVSWDNNEKKVVVTLKEIIIELWIGKNVARVNGMEKKIDPNNPKVVPMIINGRTMLPVRFVAENLGCDVQWNPDTKTVIITYPKD